MRILFWTVFLTDAHSRERIPTGDSAVCAVWLLAHTNGVTETFVALKSKNAIIENHETLQTLKSSWKQFHIACTTPSNKPCVLRCTVINANNPANMGGFPVSRGPIWQQWPSPSTEISFWQITVLTFNTIPCSYGGHYAYNQMPMKKWETVVIYAVGVDDVWLRLRPCMTRRCESLKSPLITTMAKVHVGHYSRLHDIA